jgi:hypothetical protein
MASRAYRTPLKAAPLREPGQSVHGIAVDLVFRRLLPVLWLTSLACVLTILAWMERELGWHLSSEAWAFITLGLSTVCAFQFSYVSEQVEALQLGRDGERVVGQYLEQQLMPRGARIIHDVPGDGFNLDHVVIAPQGVFVIETKTRSKPRHRDARVTMTDEGLRVAGYAPNRDPIQQVRASCRWVSELLSESTGEAIQARGVVVFPGWFIDPMTRDWLNAGNPWVLEPKALPAFLTREPTVLNDRQVMMFSNHLTRYVRAREDVARKS